MPVIPALCQRLNHAAEIIEKMGEVAAERKYDGTRVQIHFLRAGFADGTAIKTFTRNLEENSLMFPELTQMPLWINGSSVVLDCEAVGVDLKTDKIMPFQMTITRKRKHGITQAQAAVPLRFFVFDILLKIDSWFSWLCFLRLSFRIMFFAITNRVHTYIQSSSLLNTTKTLSINNNS